MTVHQITVHQIIVRLDADANVFSLTGPVVHPNNLDLIDTAASVQIHGQGERQ